MKLTNLNFLENGDVISKDFGRFRSNLIIVTSIENLQGDVVIHNTLDFEICQSIGLSLDSVIGRAYFGYYFISNKGNKCFRITNKDNAKFVLLDLYYQGIEHQVINKEYERFAINDTGEGAQWIVVRL
jgi:hypothetical protein